MEGKRLKVVEEGVPPAKTKVEDSFTALPLELRLMAFNYLTPAQLLKTAALVCKAWGKVANDASLWKEVKLDGKKIGAERIAAILAGMTQLKSLKLQNMDEGADNALDAVGMSLETLDLSEINLKQPETLDSLLSRSTKLQVVIIKSCHIPSNSKNLLDSLSSSKVEKLILSELNLTRTLDSSVQRRYSMLREICVHHSMRESDMSILLKSVGGQLLRLRTSNLQRAPFLTSLTYCNQLEELHLSPVSSMTDDSLLNVVAKLQHLGNLSITSAKTLTTMGIRSFFSMQSVVGKLKRLNLYNCHHLDLSCLNAIAHNCFSMTHLDLSLCPNITPEALMEIARYCHKLRRLDVIKCRGLDLRPEDMSRIVQLRPGLAICCPRQSMD